MAKEMGGWMQRLKDAEEVIRANGAEDTSESHFYVAMKVLLHELGTDTRFMSEWSVSWSAMIADTGTQEYIKGWEWARTFYTTDEKGEVNA